MGILDWWKKKSDEPLPESVLVTPKDDPVVSESFAEVAAEPNIQLPTLASEVVTPAVPVRVTDFNWSDAQLKLLSIMGEWQITNNRVLANMDDIRSAFPQMEEQIKRSWPSINMVFVDLSRYMFARSGAAR